MIDTTTEKQWLVKTKSDAGLIDKLREELNGIHPVLCDILLQRGIDSITKSRAFFQT